MKNIGPHPHPLPPPVAPRLRPNAPSPSSSVRTLAHMDQSDLHGEPPGNAPASSTWTEREAQPPLRPRNFGPGTPKLLHAPTPPPSNCYKTTDSRVFWLTNRPYLVHRLLGKGGFGEVHEVEMLIPRGLEVDWGDNGNLYLNEDGCILLKESVEYPAQKILSSDTSVGVQQESSSGAQLQSLPQLPPLPKMTKSESMWFSLVRRDEAANDDHSAEGEQEDPGGPPLAPPPPDFPVASTDLLQGSGVFFALKLQSARNKEHLDCLVKEVDNLRMLSGEAGIVQLKEHAIDDKSFYLMILMELGACDLHEFLNRSQYILDVPSICSVWQTLVHRVEALHKSNMIHRDIKPQNFILAPTKGYCDAKILARSRASTPCKDFVYRLVQKSARGEGEAHGEGDVELVITDPATGEEDVLPLSIKLTDFGIALPLDKDVSQLSVKGPNGTVVFMAPEVVRQTVSGCRKVSMRADIWALGVMLYQMFHEGKTPVGHYLTKGGPPEALLAVASETVNSKALEFDASSLWAAERSRLISRTMSSCHEHDPPQDLPTTTTVDMVKALVASWVGAEFLVKVCKRCLVFDVKDRIDSADLRVWIDRAIETGWGLRGDVPRVVSESEFLQAASNIDSSREEGTVSVNIQTVDAEIARIGERIGATLFPEVWTPPMSSTCQDPKQSHPSARALDPAVPQGSSSSPSVDSKGGKVSSVCQVDRRFATLEEANRQSAEDDGGVRVPFRWKVFISVCLLVVVGAGAFLGVRVHLGNRVEHPKDYEAVDTVPAQPQSTGPVKDSASTPAFLAPESSRTDEPSPAAPASTSSRSPPTSTASPQTSSSPTPPASAPSPRSISSSSMPLASAALYRSSPPPTSSASPPTWSPATPSAAEAPPDSSLSTGASSVSPPTSSPPPSARSDALAEVEEDGMALRFLSDVWRNDREVVLTAAEQNGMAFQYADFELKEDREFVLLVLKRSVEALQFADDYLRKDEGFLLEVIEQNGMALQFVPWDWRKKEALVLKAVKQNGMALHFAHPGTSGRDCKKLVLEAVKKNGAALQFASEALQKDPEVVLQAVKNKSEGAALQFADSSLRDDRGFVLKAVQQNGLCLKFAGEYSRFQRPVDRVIVLAAVMQNGMALQFAPPFWTHDRQIVLAAVKRKGMALRYASRHLRKDRKIVFEAVRSDPMALRYASRVLQRDQHVVSVAESSARIHMGWKMSRSELKRADFLRKMKLGCRKVKDSHHCEKKSFLTPRRWSCTPASMRH